MEKGPRCRHRQFLASVADPGNSAGFFPFFLLGIHEHPCVDSQGHPHLVTALQGVVSAPALETAWLMVWDGHGEAWPVLWRHAEENLPSHWEETWPCSVETPPPIQITLPAANPPCPVVFMVELQKQSHRASFSRVSVQGDVPGCIYS